jgi:hypothetical protein
MLHFAAGFITCLFTIVVVGVIKDSYDNWKAARDWYE